MNPPMSHTSHPEILGRLKRAHGHLNKVIAMLEEGRDCVTVAQQLQAVESAVIKAKKALIRDHVEHCLDDAMKAGGAGALREFKEITKYL